eukprot:2652846-Alexandrium_andersonii.AAC.1
MRTDYALSPAMALDRIAGLRICLGPGKMWIRPARPAGVEQVLAQYWRLSSPVHPWASHPRSRA